MQADYMYHKFVAECTEGDVQEEATQKADIAYKAAMTAATKLGSANCTK